MNRSTLCEFWLSYFTRVEKHERGLSFFTPEQRVQMLDELMQWSDREDESEALDADITCE